MTTSMSFNKEQQFVDALIKFLASSSILMLALVFARVDFRIIAMGVIPFCASVDILILLSFKKAKEEGGLPFVATVIFGAMGLIFFTSLAIASFGDIIGANLFSWVR